MCLIMHLSGISQTLLDQLQMPVACQQDANRLHQNLPVPACPWKALCCLPVYQQSTSLHAACQLEGPASHTLQWNACRKSCPPMTT